MPRIWRSTLKYYLLYLCLICDDVLLFVTRTLPKNAPITEQGRVVRARIILCPAGAESDEDLKNSEIISIGIRYIAAENSPDKRGVPLSRFDVRNPQRKKEENSAKKAIVLIALAGSRSEIATAPPAIIKAKAARKATPVALKPLMSSFIRGE